MLHRLGQHATLGIESRARVKDRPTYIDGVTIRISGRVLCKLSNGVQDVLHLVVNLLSTSPE